MVFYYYNYYFYSYFPHLMGVYLLLLAPVLLLAWNMYEFCESILAYFSHVPLKSLLLFSTIAKAVSEFSWALRAKASAATKFCNGPNSHYSCGNTAYASPALWFSLATQRQSTFLWLTWKPKFLLVTLLLPEAYTVSPQEWCTYCVFAPGQLRWERIYLKFQQIKGGVTPCPQTI